MGAGECPYTQISVMQVPRTIAPGLTLGAALSNSTHERPCASLPVTTRRIGLGSAIVLLAALSSDLRQLSCSTRQRRGSSVLGEMRAARIVGIALALMLLPAAL